MFERVWLGMLAALFGLACAGCATKLRPVGDPSLHLMEFQIPADLQTNDVLASSASDYVIWNTAGGRILPRTVVHDQSGARREVTHLISAAALMPKGDSVAFVHHGRYGLAGLPDLSPRRQVRDAASMTNKGGDVLVLPDRDLLHLKRGMFRAATLVRIDAETLEAEVVKEFEAGYACAIARDARTNAIVVLDKGEACLDVFDDATFERRARIHLSPHHVGFDLGAADGRAWVATAGPPSRLIAVDLVQQRVEREFDVGPHQELKLELADDGRTLALVSRIWQIGGVRECWAGVFDLTSTEPRVVCEATLPTGGTVFDVAVDPRRGRVYLAGKRSFCWDYGALLDAND